MMRFTLYMRKKKNTRTTQYDTLAAHYPWNGIMSMPLGWRE